MRPSFWRLSCSGGARTGTERCRRSANAGEPAAHREGRTVHGAYSAEMRELRRLMRALDEAQRRVLDLVK
jgi:hypothetical protein